MPHYTPTLVALYGSSGGEIETRLKQFLAAELHVDSIPEVFQFVTVDDSDDIESRISEAYATALSQRATAVAERVLQAKVHASRLETYLIGPLHDRGLSAALRVSRTIDLCALDTISGGRNAIFLIARRLFRLEDKAVQTAALELDSLMQGKEFPFNRCFFIDEVNEAGQTVDREEDLVDLISNFVCLGIGSELSEVLRNNPPPYAGVPPHYAAYASFTCDRIYFQPIALIEKLAHRLAQDVTRSLFADRSTDESITELVRQASVVIDEIIEVTEAPQKDGQRTEIKPSASPESDQATYRRVAKILDKFLQSACGLLDYNLASYRVFLDRFLQLWLIQIEQTAQKAIIVKEQIAESSIKAILNVPIKQPRMVNTEEPRTWWQILTLRTPRIVQHERLEQLSPTTALEAALETHARLSKFVEVYARLATRIEAAAVNLDILRRQEDAVTADSSNETLAYNLVDNDLVSSFYDSGQYANRDTDIQRFTTSTEFKPFLTELFSYPDGNPKHYLDKYCVRCFELIRDYDVEKICEIRRELGHDQDVISLSTPFWRPMITSTREKLTLFSARGERSEINLKRVLDSRNYSSAEIFVKTERPDNMLVVQISFCTRLQDILFVAEPHPPKAFTAGAAAAS